MVMRLWPLGLLLGAVACDGGGDGPDGEPDPMFSGTINMGDTDVVFPGAHVGVASIHRAFGFATNGTGVVYMSSNLNATCDNVFDYLTTKQYDPVDVLRSGRCTASFRFNYSGESFDGLQFTNDELGPLVSVNCAMGEGVWELKGAGRDRDYFYDGPWWQGAANEFTVDVTGSDQTPQLDVDFGPNFHGQLIYGDADIDPTTGSIVGSVEVERCQQLVQTPLWGG